MSAVPSETAWLSVRIDDAPVSIRITRDQKNVITFAARIRSTSPSKLTIDLLDAAAGLLEYEEAASVAGLDLRAWVRAIVLEACGLTKLEEQLRRARKAATCR